MCVVFVNIVIWNIIFIVIFALKSDVSWELRMTVILRQIYGLFHLDMSWELRSRYYFKADISEEKSSA